MGKGKFPLIEPLLEIMGINRNHNEFNPDLIRQVTGKRDKAVLCFLLVIAVHVADLDNRAPLLLARC